MKLIMVRHGQTELNKNSIVQGRSNFPLNDRGIKDALDAATRLLKYTNKIDKIVSSPSIRALQTVKLISGKFNYHEIIETDEHFYERDFGPYDGRLVRDVFPITNFLLGYETDEEIQTRVINGVWELYKRHQGKTVLVGCHSHTIKAVLTKILPNEFQFSSFLANGAIVVFEVSDEIKYIEMI